MASISELHIPAPSEELHYRTGLLVHKFLIHGLYGTQIVYQRGQMLDVVQIA